MRERYYECTKCEIFGTTLGDEFNQSFTAKGSTIKHKCGKKAKWARDYLPVVDSKMTKITKEHGIYRGAIVTVQSLKKEGELKVIGIKPTTRQVWIEVWNPDTKFSWVVPITKVKLVTS